MKKKWIVIAVALIVLFQVLCYALFSENRVQPAIIRNQNFYIYDTDFDSLSLVFSVLSGKQHKPYNLSQRDKNIYHEKYKENVVYLEINDTFDSIPSLLEREGLLTCILQFDFSWMRFSLEEHVTIYSYTEPYIEIWESEYIWILFRWVKIKRENKGIS